MRRHRGRWVLKIIGNPDLPTTREPTEANYWRREAIALASDLFSRRPAPFVPVELLIVVESEPDEVWLWLDCLDDGATKEFWDRSDHHAAAYDLGAFNAIWSRHPPTADEFPWLARHWLRGWIEYCRPWGVEHALAHSGYWRHSIIESVLPDNTYARFAHLMADSDRLLGVLERRPETVTHHDAQWRNLFVRSGSANGHRPVARTVAVDWSFVGLAPVGADLGHMIGCELQQGVITPQSAPDVSADLTRAYLDGLTDHGWQGDQRLVRFAGALSASLQLIQVYAGDISYLHGEPAELDPEELDGLMHWPTGRATDRGVSVPEAVAGWAAEFGYLLDLGDEARDLAPIAEAAVTA